MSLRTKKYFVDLCALSASIALTGIFSLPRLPQSADMILPRHSGFWLFALAMAGRRALSWLCLGLLCATVIALAAALWVWARARRRLSSRVWLAGAILAVLVYSSHAFVAGCLDVIQNAWFMPGCVDLREPLATWGMSFAACELFAWAAWALIQWSCLAGPAARFLRPAAAVVAAALGVHAGASFAYDAGKGSLAEAVGFPAEPAKTRMFVVLIEKEGVPGYQVHQLEVGLPGKSQFSSESLKSVARHVFSRRSVFTLAGLRYLYGGYTMQLDASNLRAALVAGHQLGDPAAQVMLLENLAAGPADAGTALGLEVLADEAHNRVGPLAAAQLALGYEHLEQGEKAAYWRGRSGIPGGLLERSERGGSLKPGSVRGQIRGARRAVRVGLYARRDRQAPYALGPAQLVEAVTADASGRFEFKKLAAGDYFFAFYLDFEKGRAPRGIRVSGQRGDIRLSAAHPKADLPPLELRFE